MVGNFPPPIPREFDEFGHHKDDPRFCAYTYDELKSLIPLLL